MELVLGRAAPASRTVIRSVWHEKCAARPLPRTFFVNVVILKHLPGVCCKRCDLKELAPSAALLEPATHREERSEREIDTSPYKEAEQERAGLP